MFVSIITVTRNDFDGLKSTLHSLKEISSVYRSLFEHIIIDGLSTDQSVSYINNYMEDPILKTTFVSEKDKGIYDAMNKGVSISNGDYCFFLNSGDIIDQFVDFSKLLEVLKLNSKNISSAGIALNVKMRRENTSYLVKSREVKRWRLRMPTVHQGIIYKTLYLLNNKYDDNLKICSDFKSVVVALEQKLSFEHLNTQFTVLTYGGISSQMPFLLLRESLSIILKSSMNGFYKLVSCMFIFVNVLLFQFYFRFLSLVKK